MADLVDNTIGAVNQRELEMLRILAADGDPAAIAKLAAIESQGQPQGGLGQASREYTPERVPGNNEFEDSLNWREYAASLYPFFPSTKSVAAKERKSIEDLNRQMEMRALTGYSSGGYASGGASHQCPFCGK